MLRQIGLRVDVDTLWGLGEGVPSLLDLLDELGVRASFFVALGPDRSGLGVKSVFRKRGALGRLLRLGRVYGLRSGLRGLVLPPLKIGESSSRVLREVVQRGHEVGIHGWDHRRWQDFLPRMDSNEIERDYEESIRAYRMILDGEPHCSASPGWTANSRSLIVQEGYEFRFASDFRGKTPFYPTLDALALKTLQLPVTLPTLDELIALGREKALLAMSPDDLDIYCAHAEVEGASRLNLFKAFVERTRESGFAMCRLSEIREQALKSGRDIPKCEIGWGVLPGRAGWVAVQGREARARGTMTNSQIPMTNGE